MRNPFTILCLSEGMVLSIVVTTTDVEEKWSSGISKDERAAPLTKVIAEPSSTMARPSTHRVESERWNMTIGQVRPKDGLNREELIAWEPAEGEEKDVGLRKAHVSKSLCVRLDP